MKRNRLNRTALRRYLDDNRGKFTYSDIAEALGTCARAVGSMVAALCRSGHWEYHPRVVSKRTGQPLTVRI